VPSVVARKSWTDLTRRPARALLTIFTVSLAVASFGILSIPKLMDNTMTSEVSKARLDNLSVPVDDVALSTSQMSALARLPNVTGAVARSLFATRSIVGGHRVDTELWGVPDFSDQPVDRVLTSVIPRSDQVLVDVQDSALGVGGLEPGRTLQLQTSDGSFVRLTIAGSARGMAFGGDTQTAHLVLYAAQSTVDRLGGVRGINVIELSLRNSGTAASHATASDLRNFLAEQPVTTSFSSLPTFRAAGDWPLKSAFDQRCKILVILIVLASVSAVFLLVNTMRTMVAEQNREIGVMRAIGASGHDLRVLYLRTVGLIGLAGAVLGAFLGVGLAYLLTRLFARLIFGVTPAFLIDWPVVTASAAAGVLGAVATALPTLRRTLRVPVRIALSGEGTASEFGSSVVDRSLVHLTSVAPTARLGLRNIARQKHRSATTVVQIALAVATLLGLLSLALAVSEVTDQSWNVLDYDITLSAQPGGRLYGQPIVDAVRSHSGVAGVAAADWTRMSYRGQTLFGLGVDSQAYVREPLASGRWFTPKEERTAARVAVVGSAAARRWALHEGSELAVTTTTGQVTFSVVGIGSSEANNGYNLYTSLGALQAANGNQGVVNSIFVRASDKTHSSIDSLAGSLENALAHAGYPSRSQIMYSARASEKAQSNTMLVIVESLGLLIVAISMLGLVNAVTMSIIERTREIGVMRCIGARARDLKRMFRTETIALALTGYLLAVPLGWLLARLLQWLVLHVVGAQLPAPYTLGDLAVALVGTVVLAAAVVTLPLRRAEKLRPGAAIRYD
jgi:putative ABC transport system permease protein